MVIIQVEIKQSGSQVGMELSMTSEAQSYVEGTAAELMYQQIKKAMPEVMDGIKQTFKEDQQPNKEKQLMEDKEKQLMEDIEKQLKELGEFIDKYEKDNDEARPNPDYLV